MPKAVFSHVNIVARDWKALVAFYSDVFGCEIVPPERDLSGPELEAGTGVRDAHLRGAHLRLPGSGADGPTLEIFEYDSPSQASPAEVNAPGIAHIAFEVENVAAARDEVLRRGGSTVGEMVELTIPAGGEITFVYVRDPEGNIIELHSWDE